MLQAAYGTKFMLDPPIRIRWLPFGDFDRQLLAGLSIHGGKQKGMTTLPQ
jgi:hypothetical protein